MEKLLATFFKKYLQKTYSEEVHINGSMNPYYLVGRKMEDIGGILIESRVLFGTSIDLQKMTFIQQ